MSVEALHPGPVPASAPQPAPLAPIASRSAWERLDRIGGYVFVAFILGVGVVSPFTIMFYGFLRGDGL